MKKRQIPDEPPKAKTLDEAQRLIDELWALLVDKERQANRNSRNSSQPPSTDGPARLSGKQTAAQSSRKPGAQPGHTGHRRELLPAHCADVIHRHDCPSVCCCGGSVVAHSQPDYRHQVFDLPAIIPYQMEEHQLFHGDCESCGQRYKAHLPDTVSPTQMGPNLLALTGRWQAIIT